MSPAAKGIVAMIAACVIWGLSPLYYKLLAHVPPLEVLSHRTIWSVVFFGAVVALQGRLREVARLMAPRRLGPVALASVMISANWFLFIYSVQAGHTVEASLGYYIFPLVSVLFGVVLFGEGLGRVKLAAVALAGLAVAVLTYGLGVLPWVSLALAGLFGVYGVIKKRVEAGPVVSVTVEVLVLAPLALVWLWGVHNLGWTGIVGRNAATFGASLGDSLLLILSGPLMTGAPLILFSYASRRVSMAAIGLVQYLNPTLQFLIATLLFAEPFTAWHATAFPLIWAALAIYSIQSLRQDRASRRAALRSATVGTTVT